MQLAAQSKKENNNFRRVAGKAEKKMKLKMNLERCLIVIQNAVEYG